MFPSMNLPYIRKSVTWDLMRLKMGNCKVSNRVLHRLKFGQHVRYQTWCGESWSVRWESGITSKSLTYLIHGYKSKSNFNAHETALSYFWLLDRCQNIKAEACKGEKELKEWVQQSSSAMQKYRKGAAHSG